MVWRPSGELRTMAWTLNGDRPRDPRGKRLQLGLEELDARQLLSAGLGTTLPNSGVAKHFEAAHRSRIVAAHATTPAKPEIKVNAGRSNPLATRSNGS